MNLDAFYLVKLDFGKYVYSDSNLVAASLRLQLYFGVNRVPVHERVDSIR